MVMVRLQVARVPCTAADTTRPWQGLKALTTECDRNAGMHNYDKQHRGFGCPQLNCCNSEACVM